jgi:hypothetical protein
MGYMPVIPELGRLTQEDCEFEYSLGYEVSLRTIWDTKILSQKKKTLIISYFQCVGYLCKKGSQQPSKPHGSISRRNSW